MKSNPFYNRGFPAKILDAEMWDGTTYHGGTPSNDPDTNTNVVGTGTSYPVSFSLGQIVRLANAQLKFSFDGDFGYNIPTEGYEADINVTFSATAVRIVQGESNSLATDVMLNAFRERWFTVSGYRSFADGQVTEFNESHHEDGNTSTSGDLTSDDSIPLENDKYFEAHFSGTADITASPDGEIDHGEYFNVAVSGFILFDCYNLFKVSESYYPELVILFAPSVSAGGFTVEDPPEPEFETGTEVTISVSNIYTTTKFPDYTDFQTLTFAGQTIQLYQQIPLDDDEQATVSLTPALEIEKYWAFS